MVRPAPSAPELKTLSREEIRNMVCCPTCEAPNGTNCAHVGKGAYAKMRKGINHVARLQAARKLQVEEAMKDYNKERTI